MSPKIALLIGFLFGLSLIGVSTGYLNATQEAKDQAQSLGTLLLILAFFISIFKHWKKGSVFNPALDNFIIGVGVASKLITTVLYGFRFP